MLLPLSQSRGPASAVNDVDCRELQNERERELSDQSVPSLMQGAHVTATMQRKPELGAIVLTRAIGSLFHKSNKSVEQDNR